MILICPCSQKINIEKKNLLSNLAWNRSCPPLQLAPMEGVGDRAFRKAIAAIGGFDEATREFLRVPKNAHVKSLAKVYDPHELGDIPMAAQLMGSDLDLMAEMAHELEVMGAPRIDINCGCPSNTVTGRGAGSSLLKEPDFLCEVATSVVKAVSIPVTVKLRSGFDDTSLFDENMLAAQSSGAAYITLHPRTKLEGYRPPARWELIARAKELLKIPVVGSGDILNIQDALNMLAQTGCDALMIGRGALINPFIFHEIRSHFSGHSFVRNFKPYFATFLEEKPNVGKLKQLLGFFLKNSPHRLELLRCKLKDPLEFFDFAKKFLPAYE